MKTEKEKTEYKDNMNMDVQDNQQFRELYEKRNYRSFIWHAVFLSITVTFTEVNTVIPSLILQIGGSEIHVGLVTAIMIGVPLISQLLFAGYLHGKEKKRPALLIGINLRVLSLALIALTLSYYQRFTFSQLLIILYSELLLFTLGGAFAGIAYIDLTGKSFSDEVRRNFFTRKQLISSIGILVSVVTARWILQTLAYPANYQLLFGAAALFLLTAAFGFWRVKEKTTPAPEYRGYLHTLSMIPTVLKNDRNLRLYLLYANCMGTHVALTPFYVAFARSRYYLDAAVAGNILFIQIMGMIAASFIWPKTVKKGGFKKILYVFSLLSAVIPPAALLAGFFAPMPVYLLLFFFLGFSVSAQKVSQNAVIVELSNEKNRVLYSGIAGTLNLTIVLFPILLGTLISRLGYVPVFLAISLIAVGGRMLLKRIVCPIDRAEDKMPMT